MSEMTVCIHAKLAKLGAKDIDLVVHRYYVGRPSSVVIKNRINKYLIGGGIQCIEQIFMAEVATYPGYAVKEYCTIRAAHQSQGEKEMNQSDPLAAETQI